MILIGRAFSPLVFLLAFTWGSAPGWYRARLWRLFSVLRYEALAIFGADQNSLSWLVSNLSMASDWRRVRPMSSRPLRRQYLRKGSMSKWAEKPSASVTVWASRLMVMRWLGSLVQRANSSCTSFSVNLARTMPFL